MKILEITQSGELWEKWREAGIGSSGPAAIMGRSPYVTVGELFRRKSGLIRQAPPNEAMRRGQRLEDTARQLYHKMRGVTTRPVCVIHDEYDWLRASLDGLSTDNKRILEIKCIKKDFHALALAGKVPEPYYPQVQHQLLVTGLRKLDYWSYSESTTFSLADRVALVEVEPDRDYQMELFEAMRKFWEGLHAGPKPTPELEAYWSELQRS